MLLLGLLVAGCGDAPGSDVPDSTMVAVLTDLHLLDARLETFGADTLAVDSLRTTIFETHGLDSMRFASALDALAAEPARMRALYDSVIVEVNAQSTALSTR